MTRDDKRFMAFLMAVATVAGQYGRGFDWMASVITSASDLDLRPRPGPRSSASDDAEMAIRHVKRQAGELK